MNREEHPVGSKSLYEKQLKILGLPSGADHDVSADIQAMNALDLPPLQLPRQKQRYPVPVWGGLMAIAASLTFVLWPKHSDLYSMKGQSQIRVFHKHAESVQRLLPGEFVTSGEQVRVSLTAGQNGFAALMYFDQKNNPLLGIEDWLATGVNVKSGEVVEFSGSVKLTGENLGEKAVVLICTPVGKEAAERANAGVFADALKKAVTSSDAASPTSLKNFDCQVLSQKLR